MEPALGDLPQTGPVHRLDNVLEDDCLRGAGRGDLTKDVIVDG